MSSIVVRQYSAAELLVLHRLICDTNSFLCKGPVFRYSSSVDLASQLNESDEWRQASADGQVFRHLVEALVVVLSKDGSGEWKPVAQ